MNRDLGCVDPGAVDQFLVEFGDTYLAGRLRRAYLKRLAKDGRWETYVRFYVPDDSILHRCYYLRGLLLSNEPEAALDQVESLWLTGKSLPKACDPLLDAWKQAGRLTDALVWRRIGLAMDADLWIATIPFRETRTYVRRVIAYRLIYDHRLGIPLRPLHEDMQPIGARAAIAEAGDAPETGKNSTGS
jgi:hypothetical protein